MVSVGGRRYGFEFKTLVTGVDVQHNADGDEYNRSNHVGFSKSQAPRYADGLAQAARLGTTTHLETGDQFLTALVVKRYG